MKNVAYSRSGLAPDEHEIIMNSLSQKKTSLRGLKWRRCPSLDSEESTVHLMHSLICSSSTSSSNHGYRVEKKNEQIVAPFLSV